MRSSQGYWRTIGICLVIIAAVSPARAQTPKYDLVIVVDGAKPEQVKLGLQLRLELEKERALANVASVALPIDSYDVSKPEHKAATDRLGIARWQTVFVGVGELEASGRPHAMLKGTGPVDDVAGAARTIMAFALDKIGVKPAGPTPRPSPSAATPEQTRGSVTGRWTGPWTNSKGQSGRTTLDLVEKPGGQLEGIWDGLKIQQGLRKGNLLTWEHHPTYKDYHIRAVLAPDGKKMIVEYKVNDAVDTPHAYSGKSVLVRSR